MWRSRPAVSDVLSATSLSVANSGRSVQEFFEKNVVEQTEFRKNRSVTLIMYLRVRMEFYPEFSLFLME
jgi:hypothetical protein